MTVELQTALVERLKQTIGIISGENQLLGIVAESLEAEVTRLTTERAQLVEANTRLNSENLELREALAAKQNKGKPAVVEAT